MSDTSTMLAETCARLFGDLVSADSLRDAEAGTWPDALWAALEENGLTQALVPEDQGGVGITWQETVPILYAAGYHAAPVPLAETIIAGWLLAQAGQAVPEGVITLTPDGAQLSLNEPEVSGRLDRVPWGGAAGHVLAMAEQDGQPMLVLIGQGSATVEGDRNIGRDPRDAMVFDKVVPTALAEAPDGMGGDALLIYGALARSVRKSVV